MKGVRNDDTVPPNLDFLNKISMLKESVVDYYCARLQDIPIISFHFMAPTYPQTNKRTHKAIAVYAPLYDVGAYKEKWLIAF